MKSTYLPTIGIEIHCQLNTKSKMFCACDNNSRGVAPNTNICPVCLGFPGSLPTINQAAIEKAIRLGLGLNGTIASFTKFDRKNYFYPDLPKGYQISQYDMPIITNGRIDVSVEDEQITVGIERAHLEEDAAKLTHPVGANFSLVDYNRGGTPLVEIVSRPEMHSPAAARAYLRAIYDTAVLLGVTDGNMEEGNFKFDLNISVSTSASELGTKVELKNLNSFRFAERALGYEINRQIEILESGGVIDQETRGYDDVHNTTFSQRGKEAAHDYRYFPEPDLPPISISERDVATVRDTLPETTQQKKERYSSLGLGPAEIKTLLANPSFYIVFDTVIKKITSAKDALFVATLIKNNQKLQQKLIDLLPDNIGNVADNLAQAASAVRSDTITRNQLVNNLDEIVSNQAFAQILKSLNTQTDSALDIEAVIKQVLENNSAAIDDFKKGNENALRFLVGQVMKESNGLADPSKAAELMRKYLQA